MTATVMSATGQGLEPDLSGCVLDRYRLVRCLGVGGMGAVYEAEHTALGKRVAVKLLRPQISTPDIARRRFLREAKAVTRVEHPHVVGISDFGETAEGRVYFVMELLAGRDLGELLTRSGRLPWPRAQEILGQIVSALGAAHAQGVVHRDMKPSNCFLVDVPGRREHDFVKVLDFGIAKLAGAPGEETQALTSTDEVLGSVGYMAPEMAMGVTTDPRSDVYAVGIMMYRMLVGELPFQGGTAFQILARHVSEPPVEPRTKDPSIAPGVERIILKAMAKRPDDRFASMQAFGEAIARGDVDEHATPPTEATFRMDSGVAPSRGLVERTALLDMVSSPMGSLLAPELASGPGFTSSLDGRRASRVSSPSIVANELVQQGTDGYEPEVAPVRRQAAGTAAVREAPRGRGWGRVALGAGLVLCLGAGLGLVALVLSRSETLEEPTAPAASDRVPDPNVTTHAPRVEPVPSHPVAEAGTPMPEAPVRERQAPSTAHDGDPELEAPALEPDTGSPPPPGPAKQAAPAEPRSPRTDASVVAGIAAKLRRRCRTDGRTKVRVEGIITTSGTVASPLVSPAKGPGPCAREVVKTARFARGRKMRPMPVISVVL